MAKASMTGFQRIVHRVRPVPVGSRLRVTRYRHLSAACSVGKCPRARTARRERAFRLSVAFVTGMKGGGAAGPFDLIVAGGAGCGRLTVRPSGTGAPGVKQGG